MSRNAPAALAKAGWITLFVYGFAIRSIGAIIGGTLAAMLVPALAVAAIVL